MKRSEDWFQYSEFITKGIWAQKGTYTALKCMFQFEYSASLEMGEELRAVGNHISRAGIDATRTRVVQLELLLKRSSMTETWKLYNFLWDCVACYREEMKVRSYSDRFSVCHSVCLNLIKRVESRVMSENLGLLQGVILFEVIAE